MKAVQLTAATVTPARPVTTDGGTQSVYGLDVAWSDGSRDSVPDLGTDREAVAAFAASLCRGAAEKVHFADLIEDFLS